MMMVRQAEACVGASGAYQWATIEQQRSIDRMTRKSAVMLRIMWCLWLVGHAVASPYVKMSLGVSEEHAGPLDEAKIYCYNPPRHNFMDLFNEVSITVKAIDGPSPSVYGSSRDDLHGIIDSWVKSKLAGEGDPNLDVSERARHRTEYFTTPLDLLNECPPLWNSNAKNCVKTFSPFGISCLAVTRRKRSENHKEMRFKVTVESSFQKFLPGCLLLGTMILFAARFLAKSKVLVSTLFDTKIVMVWYCSGISIAVAAGLLILVIFTCRKVKVPGSSGAGFTVVSALGYGALWVRYVTSILRAAAAKYWEYIAVYCAIFGLMGFWHISRIRRNEERKHDFRILVLWSLRFLGLFFLSKGTRSSLVSCTMMFVLGSCYVISRRGLRIASSSKTSRSQQSHDKKMK